MANAEKKLIRYFCEVTDQESPDHDTFGDVSFDYFVPLAKAFLVRVIPLCRVFQPDPKGVQSRWDDYRRCFATPMTGREINVVCGNAETLNRYWTKSLTNIGILFSCEDDPTLVADYDLVVCLTEEEAIDLRAGCVLALHLQPGELSEEIAKIKGLEHE